MFGAAKTVFGMADPVVFETAMLVVVFGTAEPVVFPFQVLQELARFICVYSYQKKIYIQLLHVLIGQSFQSLDRDAWALPPPPFV